MDDLVLTLDAIEAHQWHIVLLEARTKRPQGRSWTVLTHTGAIRKHYFDGGNLGLVCGPDSRVAVLDFDQPDVLADMSTELGALLPWVQTRKGFHCYVQWEDHLPARMTWRGEKIGEIQRGPSLQHVVMPPSIHPDTGQPYRWLLNPLQPVQELPERWRDHLLGSVIPDFMTEDAGEGHPDAEVWEGPTPEQILFRAQQQPGARRRRNGVKFQCPGCRKDGRDRSKDNAIVYLDGRWGCAVDLDHRRDIGEVLGYREEDQKLANEQVSDTVTQEILRKIL